jgi:hypothetical protein
MDVHGHQRHRDGECGDSCARLYTHTVWCVGIEADWLQAWMALI